MKRFYLLFFFALLGIFSCSKAKTSNINVNTQTSSTVVSANNNSNSHLNSLGSGLSQTQTEVNAEMLRKIEAQQLETADPRKVANKNKENSNQTSKPTSTGKQTW